MTTGADAGDDDDAAGQPDAADQIDATAGPILSALDPPAGIVTTQVTLTGANFGATQGSGSVVFGGITAPVLSWSDGQIVTTVPDVMPAPVEVTVTTAAGTSGPQTFRVVLPPMVYVNNGANDAAFGNFSTVTTLAFDPASGALSQVGGPIGMGVAASGWGGCATAAVVHEGSRRLFASGSSGVAIYHIDPVTGTLSAVAGSPFATGASTAWGMAVNRAGTRLFVANQSPGITVFDISGAGATPIPGSPFAATNTHGIALTDNEAFLYANSESNLFYGMSVNANGGLAHIAGSPFDTGIRSFSLGTMRPGRDHLYIPRMGQVGGYAMNAATGAPSAIPGSPFAATVTTGQAHYPAFTPDGARLYVGVFGAGRLLGYSLDAAGTATPIAGSPWDFTTTVPQFTCVAISRDGRFLVTNIENNKKVAVFTLAADGTPTQVTGSPFTQTTAVEGASGMAITF